MRPPNNSSKLIPKPPQKVLDSTRLRVLMKISDLEWDRATGLLRQLAPQYLTIGQPWSKQPKETLREYCKAACDAEPLFTRYVDQWPIKRYMQKYLVSRRYMLKSRASAADDLHAASPDDIGPEATGYDGPHEESEHPAHPKSQGVSRPRMPASSNRLLVRMSGFRTTLEKTSPILRKHYERLATAGIYNMSSLVAFCQLPRHEREYFLIDQCGIRVPLESLRARLALQQVYDQYTMIDGSVAAAV